MARRADKRQRAFIQEMKVLTDHWQQADPQSFGVTEQQAQRLIEKYQAAAQSLRLVEEARSLAKARTIENRKRMGALRKEFGALSEVIDGVARSTGDKNVYARARIAPPDPRAPLPAPPEPTKFKKDVRNDGAIEVRFELKGDGHGGVVYEVARQLETLEGDRRPIEFLDVIAEKRFIDRDVPEGLRAVRYQVRAMRSSGARSDWAQGPTVYFGTQKSGTAIAAGGQSDGPDSKEPDSKRSNSKAPGSKSTPAVG